MSSVLSPVTGCPVYRPGVEGWRGVVGPVVVVAGVAGVDHVVLYGGGMASLYHLVAHLHTPEVQE